MSLRCSSGVASSSRRHAPHRGPICGDFDLPGTLAIVTGLGTLVYGISGTSTSGWASVHTIAVFTASAALLLVLLKLENRAAEPLSPPHVWTLQSLVSGTVVMLGVSGILVGAEFLTSIYLQTVHGYSALETGLAFLPFAFALTVGTVVAKHLLAHVSPLSIATIGLLVTVLASGWLSAMVGSASRCVMSPAPGA